MIAGIGIALLTAAPLFDGAALHAVSSAAPRGASHRVHPAPGFDLRSYVRPPVIASAVSSTPLAASRSDAIQLERTEDFRLSALVTADDEAQRTGRRVRRSGMAAGLSLRMTNDEGVLASEVGMAGPVGKALTRIALEAVEPR